MVDVLRKGAARVADVPPDILAALNAGEIQAATLSENLATDFVSLMAAIMPELESAATQIAPKDGITKRMAAAAAIICEHFGQERRQWLSAHPSDLVRGWGAYMIALDGGLSLAGKIDAMRPFAGDPHFGVREWAWLAIRPEIAAMPENAIAALTPLTGEDSEYLRRFACEAIRPRGVWAAHIKQLKERPELALPIIEPLHADPARYVQDSVGNWLNDAWKSQPAWVEEQCDRWLHGDPTDATRYIVKRALRNRN